MFFRWHLRHKPRKSLPYPGEDDSRSDSFREFFRNMIIYNMFFR